MPVIIIKDYTWRQTAEKIIITIPIRGKPKNVDVFAIDNYVKISFHPFMLELFLWHNIVEEESEFILAESSAILTLKKAEVNQEWSNLTLDNLSKDKKREYRCQALERAQLSAERRAKAKKEKQQELQKEAVREQIALDTEIINKINTIRDEHRKEAMAELEDWRSKAENPILSNEKGIIQENRKSYRAPLKWFKSEVSADKNNLISHSEATGNQNICSNKKPNEIANISNSNRIEENDHLITGKNNFLESSVTEQSSSIIEELSNDKNSEVTQKKLDKDRQRGKEIIDRILSGKYPIHKKSIFENSDVSIPTPRQCGRISITFSERAFPTPARESYHLEEQEWLEKQAEARRKYGFVSEDLRFEEQDPLWLKDKGDEFFKVGNYLAAINAYTRGIKLSEKMSSLYANRSAAQYALGNYRRCAEDCSAALELMVPKCESNRESRARCHARLGAALCKLSAPQHGIIELEAALKLVPDNETVKRDLAEAKRFLEMMD
ncbi:dynein assembly factor 4, axonemal-like [Chelonus insularis]|uniref:dynein assembly factor 4, axonemal-like n=1 Tax=Chelonus insularis TaxID=460826 RepID=UPI00158B447E|nr:dynein assembly factor 4, axonemal-like [Chelonus insularis]